MNEIQREGKFSVHPKLLTIQVKEYIPALGAAASFFWCSLIKRQLFSFFNAQVN